MSPVLDDLALALGWLVIAAVVLLGIAFISVGFVFSLYQVLASHPPTRLRAVEGEKVKEPESPPSRRSPTGTSPSTAHTPSIPARY